MAAYYPLIKQLHLLTVFISIALLSCVFTGYAAVRRCCSAAGCALRLTLTTTFYCLAVCCWWSLPTFTRSRRKRSWLTEKILGVIIYIALGSVALSCRPRTSSTCWIAFLVVLVALVTVIKLAVTQMPLLGIV